VDNGLVERAWFDREIKRLRRVYEGRGRVFRAVWVAVAVMVVLTGFALMLLPGPAVLVIPFGLAMLAVAFGWARRLVTTGLGDTPGRRFHASRRAGLALGIVGLALAAVAAIVALVCILNG
jgi:hypothetical protein